ncbi:MAG: tRNA (N6-threonylcarbamoyladenosine(37)-N6)-methyltransferase TrmO [Clostridia bacterium]|nr:tRNA (N6-threonylcarbamoyladenosine(37)-N6)-methyltransferase TrmO [Clostridia bacterium]
MKHTMEIIARIKTDFPTKFGVPRQSGMVENMAQIIFEPPYRSEDAIRGIEGFSHLWLIWHFSEAKRETEALTVRPPRLGGNERVGVFATRSPFRPNSLGLSSVKLERVEYTENGPILFVSGADLMDGTPIFDVKPYLPFTDSHADAKAGFTEHVSHELSVEIQTDFPTNFPKEKVEPLKRTLALDPRPSYHTDETRIYGMPYAGFDIRFFVKEKTLVVTEIAPLP